MGWPAALAAGAGVGLASSLLGGKNKVPDSPDYRGLAEQEHGYDVEMFDKSTQVGRPNQVNPYGSRTWQQGTGEVFDQAGFDAAMSAYDAQQQPGYQAPQSPGYQAPQYPSNLVFTDTGPKREFQTPDGPTFTPPIDYTGQAAPLTKPDRADFTSMENPDQWTVTDTLSPEQQRLFDTKQRTAIDQASLGKRQVGQMQDIYSDPFSIEGQVPTYQGAQGRMPGYRGPQGPMPGFQGPEGDMPKYGEHRQNVMNAMLARTDTDIGRDRERVSSQLIAQGIPPGSEAYNRQMEQLDRKQTDARQQAEIAAEGMAGMGYSSALAGRGMESQEGMNDFLTSMQARGMTRDEAMDSWKSKMAGREMTNREGMDVYKTGLKSHQQQIQDDLLRRNQPANEYNALNTGQQIGMPQFQGYQPTPYIGGPDLLNAGMAQGKYDMMGYNADVAGTNALTKGMFDLAGAGMPWLLDQ